ncbi:bifunctional DNA-formamidopyrimidine glycosylase/DNA-(apurinic or apyrimidinic site) lyase [Stieleria sp. TO1_6]|uniref:bifunctional DNA-formamidopyrimidine glycosylase/DNA-(apurinic or apyrimidinic site) lyase n=1 Tax=Stieleria tagensis TaxID=2956795 RepID=UPI00209BB798|nr:bifunctional DNA-formamidopyrimidine glycosylase/DNA-(apurinic or apyrimidinic site) lyase [Stieleria tagensis]MCO8120541.1 bifunctional DNA-formamidopyrimidine glycosylase/DNA-(apurinic or apyrimidinic site) lyase [Stieleria tagensis]
MPELPEVETMRRGVSPIVGQQIQSAQVPPCERKPILLEPSIESFDARVRGRRITAVDRLGKRVLIVLGDDQTIVIEPRMTGLVLLSDPPGPEHLRLRLNLTAGPCGQLLFWDRRGLGTVRLLSADQLQATVRDRLGPDAMRITTDQLRTGFGSSRRQIKPALLDQTVVAGIGNLYAAEILFLAGVDPRTRCDRLSKPQWSRIHAAITAVLGEAIEHEGSTLSDGTYRNALNHQGSYQNYHRVYDRADSNCRRCRSGLIRRIVQNQRSTFFCPQCQRKSGLHAQVARIEVSPPVTSTVQ